MLRLIPVFLLIIFFLSPALAFPTTSQTLQQLWDIPTDSVRSETIRSYVSDSVQVEEVYINSRAYQGKPVKIFGYYSYPRQSTAPLPAILLVHGGGGTASFQRAVAWARRGYAVLSIDLPGKGENRSGSRSTGPDMFVSNLLNIGPNLEENYLVHAVAAARNAITFLTQRKEVDKERIGMVGLSWGGVITLLTNGQDDRLKTAVNIFGAGYIPEGCTWQDQFAAMGEEERFFWYSSIDPKNFFPSQHAPILFITGTNDHCYYLPAFQKSYAEIPVPKKLYLVPNLKHRFLPDTQRVVFRWLDNQLKTRASFPEIELASINIKEDSKIVISTRISSSSQISAVKLLYAPGPPRGWTSKEWKEIPAFQYEGIYYATIPITMLKPEVIFYLTAYDSDGGAASTQIRSLFKLILPSQKEICALSSPIHRINFHQTPLIFLGENNLPRSPQIYYSKEKNAYYLINYSEDVKFKL